MALMHGQPSLHFACVYPSVLSCIVYYLLAHKAWTDSLVLQVQGPTQGHHESSTRISSAVLGKAMRRLSTF